MPESVSQQALLDCQILDGDDSGAARRASSDRCCAMCQGQTASSSIGGEDVVNMGDVNPERVVQHFDERYVWD